MTQTNAGSELPFSADFSSRVLQQVDGIVRRRREHRMTAAALAAIAILSGAVVAGMWSVPRPQQPQVPVPVALAASDETGVAAGPSSDPLAFLFPDAEPVARFADQYTAASAPVEERNAFALATPADESENEDL